MTCSSRVAETSREEVEVTTKHAGYHWTTILANKSSETHAKQSGLQSDMGSCKTKTKKYRNTPPHHTQKIATRQHHEKKNSEFVNVFAYGSL